MEQARGKRGDVEQRAPHDLCSGPRGLPAGSKALSLTAWFLDKETRWLLSSPYLSVRLLPALGCAGKIPPTSYSSLKI